MVTPTLRNYAYWGALSHYKRFSEALQRFITYPHVPGSEGHTDPFFRDLPLPLARLTLPTYSAIVKFVSVCFQPSPTSHG